MRSAVALISVAAAYVLLRGHPESWPPVVRACVAVVCLFAGLGCWAVVSRAELPVLPSRKRAGWVDSVALGAVVLVAEVAFLGFFRAAPEPLERMAGEVEAWLRPEAAEKRRLAEQREAEARGGNWLWDDRGRRPLPRRTNFKPGNRPEVFLRPAGDGGALLESRLYVHAFAMGGYRDGGWESAPETGRTLRAGNDGWIRLGGTSVSEPVSFRVYLGREPSGQSPLVGVQGLVAVRVPELAERSEGHLLLPEDGGEGYEYDAVSRPMTLDEVGPDAQVPPQVPEVYLELPDDLLGGRIRHFTEAVSGEGTVVDRLKRIRNHLRTTLDYSLVTENPKDRDPLENFLFEEQRGHCTFFATAGALMSRAAGVPSRICFGWSGGTYYEGSRLFVFRSREAHAWAEVFLEGVGWVVLDPTPPSALDHERPALAPPDEPAPVLEDPAAEAPATAAQRPLPWVFGVAALAMLPLVLLWPLRRRGAARPGFTADGQRGGGGYARRLGEACRRRGVRCFPGRTLRSMIDALEEVPEFADDLLAYHYAVRYEGGGRDREVERHLASRVRAWDDQRR